MNDAERDYYRAQFRGVRRVLFVGALMLIAAMWLAMLNRAHAQSLHAGDPIPNAHCILSTLPDPAHQLAQLYDKPGGHPVALGGAVMIASDNGVYRRWQQILMPSGHWVWLPPDAYKTWTDPRAPEKHCLPIVGSNGLPSVDVR